MQEKSWLERNRAVVMWFALVVLILNIVLFFILPSQTSVSFAGSYPCYASSGTALENVELALTGVITKSPFSDAVFTGSVSVSGFADLETPVSFTLTRTDGKWEGKLDEAGKTSLLCIAADKALEEPVIVLSQSAAGDGTLFYPSDVADSLYLAPSAVSSRAAEVLCDSYFGS